jgi:Flp pilus assembly protein TadB
VSAEVRTGSSFTVARRHALTTHPWCDRSPGSDTDEHAALVHHTLHSVHALGGPGSVSLDAAASLLRERVSIHAEVAVHSAQARLSARVMTAVPVAFCAWSLASSASFRRAWLSPIGVVCAVCGGLCNLCGWWWMNYSIGRVER